MEIVADRRQMQEMARRWREQDLTIAFVPTMGYFHRGHLSLMEYGRQVGDKLVVSLFVTPTQFGPGEDLDRYPRDLERDAAMAREVDVLFTPTAEQIYPPGYQTYVTVEGVSGVLCGASRPGHFRGVATVVLKLFNLVMPHVAVFREKDYQQLVGGRRMVADLNLPIQVVGPHCAGGGRPGHEQSEHLAEPGTAPLRSMSASRPAGRPAAGVRPEKPRSGNSGHSAADHFPNPPHGHRLPGPGGPGDPGRGGRRPGRGAPGPDRVGGHHPTD